MRRSVRLTIATLLLIAFAPSALTVAKSKETIRFATFNASLNRSAPGMALAHLSAPGNAQAAAVAEIIQRTRPDVLLINEFDFYEGGALVKAFQKNYLSRPHNGARPISYPFTFVAPSNTGIHTGLDLDNNGIVNSTPNVPLGTNPTYGNDSYGFGDFPGQFGMAVFSRYPIDHDAIRTFQHFLWKDMPGAMLPDDPATEAPADWYSPAELAVFRLSSKSHWDVPIRIGGTTVHFLVSHPTPPVFDGLEDRNGTRNNDEIRLWADYITGGETASYIYDDEGVHGGLSQDALFVIAGDQNSDPLDGDSVEGSIQQLLEHPLVNTDETPSSAGGPYWAEVQDVLNDTHQSDPAFDTADFCDFPAFPPCSGPGNLRADYVLPSTGMSISDSAVFWPVASDPLVYLTGTGFPVPSSDHRLVWVDVNLPD
jgi:hypothetical protein